jgi:hypothetical protein
MVESREQSRKVIKTPTLVSALSRVGFAALPLRSPARDWQDVSIDSTA